MGNSESTPGAHSSYEDGATPRVEGSEESKKETTTTNRKRVGSEEGEQQQQQQQQAHEEEASHSHRADSSGHAHRASTLPSPRQRQKSPLSPESGARGKLSSSPTGGGGKTIDADSGNLFQCLGLGCGSCERPSEYGDRRRMGSDKGYTAGDFRGMQWKDRGWIVPESQDAKASSGRAVRSSAGGISADNKRAGSSFTAVPLDENEQGQASKGAIKSPLSLVGGDGNAAVREDGTPVMTPRRISFWDDDAGGPGRHDLAAESTGATPRPGGQDQDREGSDRGSERFVQKKEEGGSRRSPRVKDEQRENGGDRRQHKTSRGTFAPPSGRRSPSSMPSSSFSPRSTSPRGVNGMGTGLSNIYPLTDAQRNGLVYVRESKGFDFEGGQGYIRPQGDIREQGVQDARRRQVAVEEFKAYKQDLDTFEQKKLQTKMGEGHVLMQYKPALDLAVRNETLRRNREETNSSSFFNPFGRVYTTDLKGNSREEISMINPDWATRSRIPEPENIKRAVFEGQTIQHIKEESRRLPQGKPFNRAPGQITMRELKDERTPNPEEVFKLSPRGEQPL